MSSVRIVVNGVDRTVPAGTNLAVLVGEVASSMRGVAAAIDREVIPRSRWDQRVLAEGESIEIVTAAAGG